MVPLSYYLVLSGFLFACGMAAAGARQTIKATAIADLRIPNGLLTGGEARLRGEAWASKTPAHYPSPPLLQSPGMAK